MKNVPTFTIEVPGASFEALTDIANHTFKVVTLLAPTAQISVNRDPEDPAAFAAHTAADEYRVIKPSEFMSYPPMEWHIRNVLPKAGFVSVVSPPGSGKSFLTLDMLIAMQRGVDWFGYKVAREHRSVYLAAEGASGVRNRYHAFARAHKLDPDHDLPGIITREALIYAR